MAGADPTVFNHNLYINVGIENLVVKNNILTRASATGLQARSGGIVENNLFVQNPISLTYGYVLGGSMDKSVRDTGISGSVTNNIILEGTDIGSKSRGVAMEIANVNDD